MEELELGLKNNKKLIPILYREPEKGTEMHEKLAATNWVYLRKQDDYDATIPKLIESIQTDLGWVRQHTRLLQRATEWDSKKRNNSFLLQGADLEDAERWMTEAAAQKIPRCGSFASRIHRRKPYCSDKTATNCDGWNFTGTGRQCCAGNCCSFLA